MMSWLKLHFSPLRQRPDLRKNLQGRALLLVGCCGMAVRSRFVSFVTFSPFSGLHGREGSFSSGCTDDAG